MSYYGKSVEKIDFFREKYEFLSNFYPCKMELGGLVYYSAEAAYQAQKTTDKNLRERFSRLSAKEAKILGSEIEVRENWDENKFDVMLGVEVAKFTQNPHLLSALLDTGRLQLVEGNDWGDVFWGIDLETGKGQNKLGIILMNLRMVFSLNPNMYRMPAVPVKCIESADSKISVKDSDITLSDCECIVNSVMPDLSQGSGVDGAVRRIAGSGLDELEKLGGINRGEAIVTPGYGLDAKYIIHTSGPEYPCEGGERVLESCYISCLELAKAKGIKSIAFPVISTGKNHYPLEDGCKTGYRAVKNWLERNESYSISATFYCPVPPAFDIMAGLIRGDEK